MSESIAAIPYFIVERIVKDQAQTTVDRQYELQLFETKICTFHDEFPIESVSDMSFRSVSGENGILYLHTYKGVYSFFVRTDPKPFIRHYQELKRKLKR